MEVKRNFFIFAFFLVLFFLWQQWQEKWNFNKQINMIAHKNVYMMKQNITNDHIIIQNDVIRIIINMHGGDIEKASLLGYKKSLGSSEPLKLLDTQSDFVYQAQSGLIGRDGIDNLQNNDRPTYFSKNKLFILSDDQKEICVPITFIKKNGVKYIKKYILQKGSYAIKVKYDIYNPTNNNLELKMFGQLKQTINVPTSRNISSNNFALQTFRGAAYSNSNEKYKKYKFNTISENKNLYITSKNVWVAMLQQYFATAWIPDHASKNIIYTSHINHKLAIIGYLSDLINIPSHSYSTVQTKLWIGPEIQKDMAFLAPNLDLTVDYGWLWFLSQPLFKLLSGLYNIIGNWGFSIIMITFLMRIVTYPLTRAQYIAVAKMRFLQPKINDIKNKFADDQKRMSQEIMSLYKKEKINPLGGCLPVLIQMPIFLSLYYMLIGSVELRHAPFILWINDLSNADPYYILPCIMGLTMFLIQKISPNNISDPTQQKIMNFMPIVFTGFFLWFPSGLVLYYIVSNLITIIQQKFILSRIEKK